MEEYKKLFEKKHKLNSLISCTLSNAGDTKIRELTINKAYINPDVTNGLHMMSGTYLYTNPPPYGYGSPAPYVAATVNRAYKYNHKSEESSFVKINDHLIVDSKIADIKDFPKTGIIGNFNPSIAWLFSQTFLIKNFKAIIECSEDVIGYLKSSNSDVLSKGRQTWDPETQKSTTCSKAFNAFLALLKRNLNKTPSTLIETLILWYEMYNLEALSIIKKKRYLKCTKRFMKKLKMRISVNQLKFRLVKSTIKGRKECNKWLDDYARSFCSYIKHAERGKKDRRAIASGSVALRLHLKIIEEFHLALSKKIPGSTISIGGEEKKRKIMNELQMSSLKENFNNCYSLQATEDATKWNECLNPQLFALIHKCWFDDEIRRKNNLPSTTDNQRTFEKICRMGFYYLLIKRIHLGIGFILENDHFFTRIPWHETKITMLNDYNKEWFKEIQGKIDEEDYIPASPGFLMGMLNAGSTTVGLVAISGIEIPNTIIRCLRSSDDSMTVFVADTIQSLASLIGLTYSVYRLFGINPSREKTILFPESFGEYTSWYQDKDFVGQYGVETSSLKPMGKNPQDDFNSIAANTLQLMRTHVINVFGAFSRLTIGVDNVRRLWNIKSSRGVKEKEKISPNVIFLADGGKNPWVIENIAVDESSLRYKNIQTDEDREYFLKVMDPGNPFSEPSEEQLLYNKDVGLLVSTDDDTPRNAFCFIRRSNRTNKNEFSKQDIDEEQANQEAFEIATAIDPSFLLTIPNSKTPLNKYLASSILLLKEKLKDKLPLDKQRVIDLAILRLTDSCYSEPSLEEEDYEIFDNL